MKKQKLYEASDKMITLLQDNYAVLRCLGSFGINLGFGNKTVEEVCIDEGVDSFTFLCIVNYTINGYLGADDVARLSVPTLMQYLKSSHEYYLDFELPFIRKELIASLDAADNLASLIIKIYDEYARSIVHHMKYEEKNVFPYVEALLQGKAQTNYDVETFSKHHDQIDVKMRIAIISFMRRCLISIIVSHGLPSIPRSKTISLYRQSDCLKSKSTKAIYRRNCLI